MLIAFEGPDGVGKTTFIKKLKMDTRFLRYKFTTPFSTDIGLSIKKILNDPLFKNINEITKIELMSKVFLDTQEKIINKYDYVIIDRWVASFYAYQDVPNNPFAKEMFSQYFDYSLGILSKPDYTFYLNADDSILFDRLNSRKDNDQLDDYFKEKIQLIKSNYKQFIEEYDSNSNYSIIFNHDFSDEVYDEISNTLFNLT